MAAGLGFKEFAVGDILTAADANGYLASQTVMVFASSAARAAICGALMSGNVATNHRRVTKWPFRGISIVARCPKAGGLSKSSLCNFVVNRPAGRKTARTSANRG